MRIWGHQGQAAPESLPSTQGWQLGAWWALGGAEGPSPPQHPRLISHWRGGDPAAPVPPLHRSPFMGGLARSAGSPSAPRLLPAGPPRWSPSPGSSQAQGGEQPGTEHNVAPCSPARPSLLELARFLPGLRGSFQGK